MKAPVWWKQIWCRHSNMIKGVHHETGEPWMQCLTCGRRTGAARAEKKQKKKQPFWRPPNFPKGPPG